MMNWVPSQESIKSGYRTKWLVLAAVLASAHGAFAEPISAPVVVVTTKTPTNINIGTTVRFELTVQNVGNQLAEGVIARTTLPPSVEVKSVSPQPEMMTKQVIQFNLGNLPPRSTRKIVIELVPLKRGPVKLNTRASYSSSTQSAFNVQQPRLRIVCYAPETAIYGKTVSVRVVVSNTGNGSAEQVVRVPTIPQANPQTTQPNQASV